MADINLERIIEQEKQYKYLLELEDYFIKNYPNLKFKILSIQNIKRENTTNITNLYNNDNNHIEKIKYGNGYDNITINLFIYLFDYIPRLPKKKLFE